jgi:DNA ligase (NAD+)
MDINNIGERTIDLLYKEGKVKTPADLYRLSYDDIYNLEGFKDLSTKNILQGIEDSKKAPFENVLFALGIRYVGKTVAEKLAKHFKNIDNLKSATFDELNNVPEIGERIAASVIEFFENENNVMLVESLRASGLQFQVNEIVVESVSNILQGKSFVISGVFENFERDELKDLIVKNGGKVLSSISGKLDFLLAGANMGPAKLEKAKSLGIKMLGEDEFIKMIHLQ